jgi:filamentous hemagglutinin
LNILGGEWQQYEKLMENAASQAKRLGLSIGQRPTKQQLSNLEEDFVWLVEKVVDGERVLAPEVYLTQRTKALSGAVISAGNIDLVVDKAVENAGTIYAHELLKLDAKSISNRLGDISSESRIDLTALNDIQNISGTITGADVKLSSTEGDIVNKTLTNTVSKTFENGEYSYTQIGEKASIMPSKNEVEIYNIYFAIIRERFIKWSSGYEL